MCDVAASRLRYAADAFSRERRTHEVLSAEPRHGLRGFLAFSSVRGAAVGDDPHTDLGPNAPIRVTLASATKEALELPSPSGGTVRLRGSERRLTGWLHELDATDLTLRLDSGQVVRIPRESISVIESKQRRGSRGVGALLGGVVGFGTVVLATKGLGGTCEAWGGGNVCVTFGLTGAATGALIGGVVAVKPRWTPTAVEWPKASSLPSPRSRAGGWRLDVTVGF